jgi:hypothetical protein
MRRFASFAIPAFLVVVVAACSKEQGQDYACKCTFLTDFDDGSSIDVNVCSPSLERLDGFARGCAQAAAPAPIEACTCKLERSDASCSAGACRLRVHEP